MKPSFIFMGTPNFGVPSLDHLFQQGYQCLGVVTQPDRAKGRGHRLEAPPVKKWALEHELPVWQPESVNTSDFLETLTVCQPDVIIVAAFGQILKQPILDLPPLGCINLHGSLLPKYRGAAPVQWSIVKGEIATGVTVQHMVLKVDSGAILVQHKVPIGANETSADLFARLAALGGPALEQALELLVKEGKEAGQPQDEAKATFAPRLSKDMGVIDWQQPAQAIHNLVRGFYPWPGTYTNVNQERLKVLVTKLADTAVDATVKPGTIIQVCDQQGWLVAAGNQQALWVENVQCANTKAMAAQAYTCGYHVGHGDQLGKRS